LKANEVQRCPLCGSPDRTVLYPSNLSNLQGSGSRYHCTNFGLGMHADIYRCLSCGMVFNDPAPAAADHFDEYARAEDPDYLEQRLARRQTYARELDRLEPFVEGRELLDVGCYAGFFLELARERGFRVEGIEPSRWAAQHAGTRLGLSVSNCTIEEFPTDRRYDVVTLWDVIEHLSDPVRALQRIRTILLPGGIVAFTTHNLDSLMARLLRGRYPFFMEMHTIHLDNRTLPLLLKKAGFALVDRHPHRRALHVGYMLSRLRRFGDRPAALAIAASKWLGLADRIVWIGGVGLETIIARPSEPR